MPIERRINAAQQELQDHQAAFLRQRPGMTAAILEAVNNLQPLTATEDPPFSIENPDPDWVTDDGPETPFKFTIEDPNPDWPVIGPGLDEEGNPNYDRTGPQYRSPGPPPTNYLGGYNMEPGGVEDPRFDLSGGPGWPSGPPGPPGGYDSPPPGEISGPSREFSPHGDTIGQFSAPRTYGGLPRSTGPWGVPGGWYNQQALATALRGQ